MPASPDLATLQFGDFAPHCDTVFEMRTPAGVVPLKLAKIDQTGESGRPGGAFSLLLIAPQGPWHPQAIYPLTHPAMGAMAIFLVPIGPASGGNGYYATFT